MSQPVRKKSPSILIASLVVIGCCFAALALWLVDHRLPVRNSGLVIAFAMVSCFVCLTWALLLYIAWRDHMRGQTAGRPLTTRPGNHMIDSNLSGTIYNLVPDTVYEVQQSFTDYYGGQFQQGELLRFKERHFLPYHGGHTIVFAEKSLYLQETENADILGGFSQYIALAPR